MKFVKSIFVFCAVTVLVGGAPGAVLAGNLVQNGGFEDSAANNRTADVHPPGWTMTYGAIQAVVDGNGSAVINYGAGNPALLWSSASSPNGGNYFISDADPVNAYVISQTITGLYAGEQLTLSFDYAAGQFARPDGSVWNGQTTSGWYYQFGDASLVFEQPGSAASTTPLTIPSHGFSGWQTVSVTVTATGDTDILSFMAYGTANLPPVAMLDGVTLTANETVPEPSSFVIFSTGVIGATVYCLRRSAQLANA